MKDPEALLEVQKHFGITSIPKTLEGQFEELTAQINHLLNNDFQKLIYILYRMDINESKLRRMLRENQGTDAGRIIANLVIEREGQKIKSREESKKNHQDPGDDNEKW